MQEKIFFIHFTKEVGGYIMKKKLGLTTKIFIGLILGAICGIILYKYIPEDTPIEEINANAFKRFVVDIGKRKDINSQSLNTYARDLKTIMYFFMRQDYITSVKLNIPKVDKTPIETYTDSDLQKLLKKLQKILLK